MGDDSGLQMGDDSVPDRYGRHMWRFMESHVNAPVDVVAVNPGDAVLDVACGTGFVARTVSYLSALPWGQSFFELDSVARKAALAEVSERLAGYRLPSGNLAIPFKAFM